MIIAQSPVVVPDVNPAPECQEVAESRCEDDDSAYPPVGLHEGKHEQIAEDIVQDGQKSTCTVRHDAHTSKKHRQTPVLMCRRISANITNNSGIITIESSNVSP